MKLGWKIWAGLFVVGVFYLLFIHDNLFAYINWKTLTKQDIVREANLYIERHNIQQDACLYVVECIDDEAHLRMVKNIDTWDIEETKNTVWLRKFKDVCTGRTANIGIDFISNIQKKWTNRYNINTGVWSFSTDKFFRRETHFTSYSFSQRYPWQACTPENAIFTATKP